MACLSRSEATDLQQPQALQPFLHQLLYPPFLRLVLVLAESIPGPPAGVFAEVILGELRGIAEEGTELERSALARLVS